MAQTKLFPQLVNTSRIPGEQDPCMAPHCTWEDGSWNMQAPIHIPKITIAKVMFKWPYEKTTKERPREAGLK